MLALRPAAASDTEALQNILEIGYPLAGPTRWARLTQRGYVAQDQETRLFTVTPAGMAHLAASPTYRPTIARTWTYGDLSRDAAANLPDPEAPAVWLTEDGDVLGDDTPHADLEAALAALQVHLTRHGQAPATPADHLWAVLGEGRWDIVTAGLCERGPCESYAHPGEPLCPACAG